jgi:hypothetical protein
MMIGWYIESIFADAEQSDDVEALKKHAFEVILASL